MATRSPFDRPRPSKALARRHERSFHCAKVIARLRSRAPMRLGDKRAYTKSICPKFNRSFIIQTPEKRAEHNEEIIAEGRRANRKSLRSSGMPDRKLLAPPMLCEK